MNILTPIIAIALLSLVVVSSGLALSSSLPPGNRYEPLDTAVFGGSLLNANQSSVKPPYRLARSDGSLGDSRVSGEEQRGEAKAKPPKSVDENVGKSKKSPVDPNSPPLYIGIPAFVLLFLSLIMGVGVIAGIFYNELRISGLLFAPCMGLTSVPFVLIRVGQLPGAFVTLWMSSFLLVSALIAFSFYERLSPLQVSIVRASASGVWVIGAIASILFPVTLGWSVVPHSYAVLAFALGLGLIYPLAVHFHADPLRDSDDESRREDMAEPSEHQMPEANDKPDAMPRQRSRRVTLRGVPTSGEVQVWP